MEQDFVNLDPLKTRLTLKKGIEDGLPDDDNEESFL